jgi:L-asparaginase II
MKSQVPLFSLLREGFPEVSIQGELAIVGEKGVCFQTSSDTGAYPARSLLKPFQFLAAGLPLEQWAVPGETRFPACVGSISATRAQVEQLEQWYEPPELKALLTKLRVPLSYPMDDSFRVKLKEGGQPASQWFHTCFSKHLAILQSCVLNGWDLNTYTSQDHPFHKRLLSTLSSLLKEDLDSLPIVTDGCALPSPVLTTTQMARLYQKLGRASDNRLGSIRKLMLAYPQWIGGPGRLDTKLMRENPGKLLAKEGASGIWGLSILPGEGRPEAIGIVLKLAAGYYPPLAAIALAPVLSALGLNEVHSIPVGQKPQFHFQPHVFS